MRALFSSTRGSGHFNPLVPFARAFERAGHEVLVAGPPPVADSVERAGFAYWQFDAPGPELDELWSHASEWTPEEGNRIVVGEIFGRLNSGAALPRLQQACAEWRPDLVVREVSEFGSALAAEAAGIPCARVAVGLEAFEEEALRIAAARLGEVRESAGLPPDPDGETFRRTPYLTVFPGSFEAPGAAQPHTHRFRDPSWDAPPAALPPHWWPGDDRPLVYVSFGSVAAANFEGALAVYDNVIEAVAELPVRVLLTIGNEADPARFGAPPANVRIERWVPQADVLAHATAVVCHGGSGTTLGALAAGLPLVVAPLFADQPHNAERVAALGAGVSVAPETEAIRTGVEQMLSDDSYRDSAATLANEMRAQPPVDDAVDLLATATR